MTDLVGRVSLTAALATGLLTVPAAWLGGSSGALGVASGGALAIANLWWLARRARLDARRGPLVGWALAASLRLLALALVVAALLVTGSAHPIGLVVGLSVLPPVLIAAGLQETRPASSNL